MNKITLFLSVVSGLLVLYSFITAEIITTEHMFTLIGYFLFTIGQSFDSLIQTGITKKQSYTITRRIE